MPTLAMMNYVQSKARDSNLCMQSNAVSLAFPVGPLWPDGYLDALAQRPAASRRQQLASRKQSECELLYIPHSGSPRCAKIPSHTFVSAR
eukprot:3288166-Pleurochrysis_carterae.AAC.2